MPKAITLGNGNILVGLDEAGQVRDFYFPRVGLENHINGAGGAFMHRVGVWVDGELRWLGDPSWKTIIDCDQDAGAGSITAVNSDLNISLRFTDVVYNERNIFIRQVNVENLADTKRDVRVFFAQQFRISRSRHGGTAYYDPRVNAVVHYKGKRAFLVNGRCDDRPFDDYTVGLFGIEGKEGSHLDAHDGELSQNGIEHGSVDSVIRFKSLIDGKGYVQIHLWVAAGKSIEEVHDLDAYVFKKGPEHLVRTTKDYWNAWVHRRNFSFYGLPKEIADLFKKSLFIVRSHVDNGGAVIASSDSDMLQHGRDTYGYMWPRDGALTALALERSGDFNVARRFFEFCNEIITDEGYFMHKYRADGSLGSSWHPWVRDGKFELPIQEDETALVLFALKKHYDLSKDLEFIESIYTSLIERAAMFLTTHIDKRTGLPLPTYDLWEEKYGTSTFTAAATYGALNVAADFAKLLGKTKSARRYRTAARTIHAGILKHLYDRKMGMFVKSITVTEDGKIEHDSTVDMSSFYGVFTFEVLPVSDRRMKRSYETVMDRLWNKTEIGGIIRYENDAYYRINEHGPSNPWFITTLWLAQYYIKSAKKADDLNQVSDLLMWVKQHSLRSGVLSEQIHPYTGSHLSTAPLTWSHSEFIITILDYLEKVEELGLCDMCNPVE